MDIGEAYTVRPRSIRSTRRPGGGAEQVTPTFDHTKLAIDVSASIHNGRADPGTVGKLARFIVNVIHEVKMGDAPQRLEHIL